MNYAQWIQAVCALLEYQIPDAVDAATAAPTDVSDFNNIIPSAIDYTENRIQRDLDLIATTVTIPQPGQSAPTMIPNQRLQTLPSVNLPAVGNIPALLGTPIPPGSLLTTTNGSAIVNVEWPDWQETAVQGQNVSILSPVTVGGLTLGGVYNIIATVDANNFSINAGFTATANASATIVGNGIYVVATQIRPIVGGIKQPPLEVVSRDYLDYAWPDDNSVEANIPPVQWCPNDQATFIVGPAPDQAYGFETVGTMRIPQLSPANYTNFLTAQFPDLYVACSMIFFSGFQRDFGQQSDDPARAQSWENQYQTMLKSAGVEETRKRYGNMFPSPSNPATVKG